MKSFFVSDGGSVGTNRPCWQPGQASAEAVPPSDPERLRKGDRGDVGLPPPRSSSEHGGDYPPFVIRMSKEV